MANELATVPPVSQYMTRSPISIDADAGLTIAATLMQMNRYHHLPVTRSGKIVGMISARDLFIPSALGLPDIEKIRVGDIARTDVYMIASTTSLYEVVREMSQRNIGSVILLEEEVAIGIFTTTNALHALADMIRSDVKI